MKAVLITGHDARSPRKVDFHFWADILVKKGWDICFITAGLSFLTTFKPSPRIFPPPYNQWIPVSPSLNAFIWRPLFHPCVRGGALSPIFDYIFSFYPSLFPSKAIKEILDTNLFIIECGAPLMLVPKLKKICPDAKFIYSVSDRMETVDIHPLIRKNEIAALPLFDSIRVPSELMIDDYTAELPVHFIAPGVTKDKIDADVTSPYRSERNAICIGDMLFDSNIIEYLAKKFPDWTIHLFGRGAKTNANLTNIIHHGEVPFDELIPYLKHADIGLAPYKYRNRSEYLCQSSLKMTLYKYCRLPIVAPDFVSRNQNFIFTYVADSSVEGVDSAFIKAILFDRENIDVSEIDTWDQMFEELLGTIA